MPHAQNIELRQLTTFRIGGTPSFYSRPRSYDELAEALGECRRRNLPFRVLGGGSNLLVDEGRLPFAVIHVCSPAFDWVRRADEGSLRVGAGTRVSALLRRCQELGLGGLEFMAGIPGTVGGAVCGNAGAWGACMGDRISRTWSWDCGQEELLPSGTDELSFGYRHAELPGDVVTEVEFHLTPRSPDLIREQMRSNIRKKRAHQPTGDPNAGCVFRNPEDESAGKLLDLCGLKGSQVGGAVVSTDHANFICNTDGASAREVLELIETMQQEVRSRFGVELKLELKHWGADTRVA